MGFSFTMLAGLPGSGKSTYAGERCEGDTDTVWLSSDKVREEIYGNEEIQGDSAEVFDLMKKRTLQALGCGKSVIYDACNINSKRRRVLLAELKKFNCEKVCIVFAVPYRECLVRNSQRGRTASEDIIRRYYMNWQTPYMNEGWDNIKLYMDDLFRGIEGRPQDFADALMDFNQDNPYHAETLGAHLNGARNYLVDKGLCADDSNLVYAALIHDCGKVFCKTCLDKRGNHCDYAHYYGHESVGAYMSMFFDYQGKNDQDILRISAIVSLHDRPLGQNWSVKKAERIYGTDLLDDIIKISMADVASKSRTADGH